MPPEKQTRELNWFIYSYTAAANDDDTTALMTIDQSSRCWQSLVMVKVKGKQEFSRL